MYNNEIDEDVLDSIADQPYSGYGVECVRFGARIGGSGIGCCAIELFQNFDHDPDAEYIEGIHCGDGLSPIMKGDAQYAVGPTNRDAFEQRLRIGTFGTNELPDRTFFVALSKHQVNSGTGKRWLAILKEHGFEFVRVTNNSVYTGSKVTVDGAETPSGQSPVYIFALFRNISTARIEDPFEPPASWKELPEPTKTPREIWNEGKKELIFIDPKTRKVVTPDDTAKTRLPHIAAAPSDPFAA